MRAIIKNSTFPLDRSILYFRTFMWFGSAFKIHCSGWDWGRKKKYFGNVNEKKLLVEIVITKKLHSNYTTVMHSYFN